VRAAGAASISFGMSLRRKDSSTAFFSHWLTCQPPAVGLGDA
jgi:hypothetical protein